LRFDSLNQFNLELDFQECILNHSSFFGCNIKGTNFSNCKLIDVDFENTNLTNSIFVGSDLNGAQFINSNLEKADFRECQNVFLDPDLNKIKAAKFSLQSLPGLLEKYKIQISF